MRDFFIGLALLALWFLLYNYAFASDMLANDTTHIKVTVDLPKELAMKTDVGEVVLTSEPCNFPQGLTNGFIHAAYATEQGHDNHIGCWKKEGFNGMEAVLVYFPEVNYTMSYNPFQFKPK